MRTALGGCSCDWVGPSFPLRSGFVVRQTVSGSAHSSPYSPQTRPTKPAKPPAITRVLSVMLGGQSPRTSHVAKHHDAAVVVWRNTELGHDRIGEKLSTGGGVPCDQSAELFEPIADIGSAPFDYSVSNEDEPLGRRNLMATYPGFADHLDPERRVLGEGKPGREPVSRRGAAGCGQPTTTSKLPSLGSSDP